jgi:hypothetical protein
MPVTTKYIYIASMDVEPDKEALLNEVYDTEHVPALLKVPGVHSITRGIAEPFAMSMGGEERQVAVGEEPKFSAIYEIDSPDVLVSDAWAAAVEAGRWPEHVRPFTSNRRQVLRKITVPST